MVLKKNLPNSQKHDEFSYVWPETRREDVKVAWRGIDLEKGGEELEQRAGEGRYRTEERENNLNRGRLHSFGDRFWNGFSLIRI